MVDQLIPRPGVPKIYAYTRPDYQDTEWHRGDGRGLIKVGQTTRKYVEERVKEQMTAALMDKSYTVHFWDEAIIKKGPKAGESFTDYHVHRALNDAKHYQRDGEWFEATPDEVRTLVGEIKDGLRGGESLARSYPMRKEQRAAVNKTAEYFLDQDTSERPASFLWNAKMRFGKTFSTYQLAKRLACQRVLVMSFFPSTEKGWKEDLEHHQDFSGWRFITRHKQLVDIDLDDESPFVKYASFQGLRDKEGLDARILEHASIDWDLIVVDEYHHGAWRSRYRELVGRNASQGTGFRSPYVLCLSGTPFKALANGEFAPEQIYTWTYSDEQAEKKRYHEMRFKGEVSSNPYESLPEMVIAGYDLIVDVAGGDKYAIDVNGFFEASRVDGVPKFKHEAQVLEWLDRMGSFRSNPRDGELIMPYQAGELRNYIKHSMWLLPSKNACDAMKILLENHGFFDRYHVICVSGEKESKNPSKDVARVNRAIFENKQGTITLSCQKLITGVTVPEWTAIFILQRINSAERYFQAAFRAQSAGQIFLPDGKRATKDKCFVFDFDPYRAIEVCLNYRDTILRQDGKALQNSEQIIPGLEFVFTGEGEQIRLDHEKAYRKLDEAIMANLKNRKLESTCITDIDDAVSSSLIGDGIVELLRKADKDRSISRARIVTRKDGETPFDELEAKTARKSAPTPTGGSEEDLSDKEKDEIRKLLEGFVNNLKVSMYLNDQREKSIQDVLDRSDDVLFEKAMGMSKALFQRVLESGAVNVARLESLIRVFHDYESEYLRYLMSARELSPLK